jgi:hypothetical protein
VIGGHICAKPPASVNTGRQVTRSASGAASNQGDAQRLSEE